MAAAAPGRRPGRPPCRDLTSSFARHRAARRRPQPARAPGSNDALLAGERAGDGGSPTRGRAALPPEWVDVAERAREELKEIQAQLMHLRNAQQRRLLRELRPDGAPDREVEVLSGSLALLVRCCEQSIHQVRMAGAGRDDPLVLDGEFRENVQRSLAAELQQLSKECREAQKSYLAEVRRRQAAAVAAAEEPAGGRQDAGGTASSSSGAMRMATGELESMEEAAALRSSEVTQIASSVAELHAIFKELARIVIDQGTVLDRIDYNTEKIYKKSDDALGQVNKAVGHKKSTDDRALKCLLFWAIADAILLLVLLIKLHIKYGLWNVLLFLLITSGLVAGTVLAWRHLRPLLCPQVQLPDLERQLPDLDPAALWRRFRPGPVAAAKAAGSAAAAGLGSMRPL